MLKPYKTIGLFFTFKGYDFKLNMIYEKKDICPFDTLFYKDYIVPNQTVFKVYNIIRSNDFYHKLEKIDKDTNTFTFKQIKFNVKGIKVND